MKTSLTTRLASCAAALVPTPPAGDTMSFTRTLRTWMPALSPAFLAPRAALPIPSNVSLNKGATTWLAQPFGQRVTCESGTLWLCYDGEAQDIVLEPGETHLCARRSALSIHALSPSLARLA
jgi:Protein of unknown function (DUF2917)